MNWVIVLEIAYLILLVLVGLRIVFDTTSTHKTLAYLLLIIFVPLLGIFFYFSFGINYRKRTVFSKKLIRDDALRSQIIREVIARSELNLKQNKEVLGDAKSLVKLLLNDSTSPLTTGNHVTILQNGEQKFPEVLRAIEDARDHIHIEYYIYEDDTIGQQLADAMIRKASQGVKVRLIFDAFGSGSIRKQFLNKLKEAGIEAFPFNRIRIVALANPLNYRNHRKIIVVDGRVGFVGGINVSDRYINEEPGGRRKNALFWRDTHLRIEGPGVQYLQYLFFCDWNFCAKQNLEPGPAYFNPSGLRDGDESVQIAASGPDSPTATVMLSILKAINLARKEIMITTPYFIPGETILNALKVAALSGVSVRILAPGISDSKLVNAAAWSYYDDLLRVGVEIYLYRKGFMHAKTIVIDDNISIAGTANMDYRSFDLNFEVNAVVYGRNLAAQLRAAFLEDLLDADKIDATQWRKRPLFKQLPERLARLLSPLL